MADALNTYGLTPLTWWKLFEVDGWQVLVSVEQDEEDDDRFAVCFSTAYEALGEVTTIRLSGTGEEWAREVFNATTDGRKALQMVLDQSGPLLVKMMEAA